VSSDKEDRGTAGEQSTDSESLGLAGLRLGGVIASKYRVDGVLGAGGMGIVVAATHLQLGDPFAIKVLRPEGSTRLEAVDRFLREARIAMRLRGEHVVRIYEVGTLDNGSPFIAMERLDGRDLRAVLHEEGRIPPSIAVDYVLQACEAIAEAHALGAIHRDLKPANLFLTTRVDGTGCVKVLDFGVSKIATDFAALRNGASTQSSDLAQSVDDSPPELEWIVHRCLAKEPRHRYDSVSSLAESLAPFASGDGDAPRILDRIKRIPRSIRAAASASSTRAPRSTPAPEPATVTEEPIVRVGGATRPGPAAFALGGALVVAISASLFLATQRRAPRSAPRTQDVGAMTAPSASVTFIAPEPPPAPLLLTVPRAIPSSSPMPMATARPQHHAVSARPIVDAAASAPSIGGAAPPPAVDPDPLRIDAGGLFDERK